MKFLLSRTPDGVFPSVRDPDPRHPASVNALDTDENGRRLALREGQRRVRLLVHGWRKDVWVSILRPTSEATG
ncbi:hypothetical protein [Streptomyces sp. KL116D]|uniref:hypothetical protein n=1 Tax=Streptomyces sp. KL116D TaxID=3045152 RepID=UPI003555F8DB